MRRMIKKWGESLLAALCVLVILFAALYTRQDDLKRMAAQNAAASQDETLGGAASAWARPVEGAVLIPFGDAHKDNGIWRFSPYVRYEAASGSAVRAIHPGRVVRAENGAVLLRNDDGTESEYRGLRTLQAKEKDSLQAGETLGRAGSEGFIEIALWRDGGYIDPETFLIAP